MTEPLPDQFGTGRWERIQNMRKYNQNAFRSEIYKVLEDARLSESDRLTAINAMQDAEAIVNAFLWVQEKIAAVGHYFLKPSLKH
jgi:hypothetical protein